METIPGLFKAFVCGISERPKAGTRPIFLLLLFRLISFLVCVVPCDVPLVSKWKTLIRFRCKSSGLAWRSECFLWGLFFFFYLRPDGQYIHLFIDNASRKLGRASAREYTQQLGKKKKRGEWKKGGSLCAAVAAFRCGTRQFDSREFRYFFCCCCVLSSWQQKKKRTESKNVKDQSVYVQYTTRGREDNLWWWIALGPSAAHLSSRTPVSRQCVYSIHPPVFQPPPPPPSAIPSFIFISFYYLFFSSCVLCESNPFDLFSSSTHLHHVRNALRSNYFQQKWLDDTPTSVHLSERIRQEPTTTRWSQ